MSNITISMTTFVDFVIARSGTPRLTAVKKAKDQYQQEYNPTKDFYKPLRECIISAAQQNLNGKKTVDSINAKLMNLSSRKYKSYLECGEGYKRWRGNRSEIGWDNAFTQDLSEWSLDRLTIRINPELGILLDGKPHIIKLYFKSNRLSQTRLETMYYLLKQYNREEPSQHNVGVLDVRQGHLRTPNRDIPDIGHLLAGEAAAFQTMWDRV